KLPLEEFRYQPRRDVVHHVGNRLALGEADTLYLDDLLRGLQPQRIGDMSGCNFLDTFAVRRSGHKSQTLQLIGPTGDKTQFVGQFGPLYESALALLSQQEPFGRQLIDGATNGYTAHPKLFLQLSFNGNGLSLFQPVEFG